MLIIQNVKHSDAGDYECQVSSVFNPNCYHIKHNNKKDSKKINLNVKHFLLAIIGCFADMTPFDTKPRFLTSKIYEIYCI